MTLQALTDIFLLAEADAFIGHFLSNLSRLAIELSAVEGFVPPFVSVDGVVQALEVLPMRKKRMEQRSSSSSSYIATECCSRYGTNHTKEGKVVHNKYLNKTQCVRCSLFWCLKLIIFLQVTLRPLDVV